MTKSILYLLLLSFITISISSCTKPIPVRHGNVINISKESIYKDEDNLAIHWFGTSNYLISLGNNSIMTDPFVSYQSMFRIIFSGQITSDRLIIEDFYKDFEIPPKAIFIGHSHYDHMLDTVEVLKVYGDKGCSVPVYGSETTSNILHGYPKKNCKNSVKDNWSENWEQSLYSKNWMQVYPEKRNDCDKEIAENSNQLCYRSFKAQHAPHLPPNIKYHSGKLKNPLHKIPYSADDFKEGDTFVYLFKFKINQNYKTKIYRVGLVGAATDIKKELVNLKQCNPDLDSDPDSEDYCFDVLILCVPGWNFKKDYPKRLLELLKPRVVILSHFDNFFETDRDKKPIKTVPLAGLDEFILQIQDDINSIPNYDRFEKIIILDVNTTIYLSK